MISSQHLTAYRILTDKNALIQILSWRMLHYKNCWQSLVVSRCPRLGSCSNRSAPDRYKPQRGTVRWGRGTNFWHYGTQTLAVYLCMRYKGVFVYERLGCICAWKQASIWLWRLKCICVREARMYLCMKSKSVFLYDRQGCICVWKAWAYLCMKSKVYVCMKSRSVFLYEWQECICKGVFVH